jgi:hypothetical protein
MLKARMHDHEALLKLDVRLYVGLIERSRAHVPGYLTYVG